MSNAANGCNLTIYQTATRQNASFLFDCFMKWKYIPEDSLAVELWLSDRQNGPPKHQVLKPLAGTARTLKRAG